MGIPRISGYSGYANYVPYTPNPNERELSPGRKPASECETCKSRKYKDGSDEVDVSFQTATHIDPASAGSAVRAHEAQHVSNAFEKASELDGKVVQASVALQTSVCPECGRVYVSGGLTTTKIMYPNESNPYQQERKAQDAAELTGAHLDYNV